MRRSIIAIFGLAVVLLVFGEIVARVILGLGTPPLSMAHPTIEYLFRPNQDVYRFGNRQIYNAYSMRSGQLPDRGIVLVMGDSVLNGGNPTDQQNLATSIMTRKDPKHFYANVSAGSWGPGNLIAYLDEFGTFDAQAAILVLNDGDIDDQPTFAPLRPNTHPLHQPVSALLEGITRYLPRYLPNALAGIVRPDPIPHPYPRPQHINSGAEDTRRILERFANAKMPTCIVLHESQKGSTHPGREKFLNIAGSASVPVVKTRDAFEKHQRDVAYFYRDSIHINEAGQAVLADLLEKCLQRAAIPTMEG